MSIEAKGQRVNINGKATDVLFKDAAAREQLANIGKTVYPVGSIYISVTDTSPASLFGGTWERLKDKFLLAAGDSYAAGSTGGEAYHTLTVNEMPSHRHSTAPLAGYYITAWGDSSNNTPSFGLEKIAKTSGGAPNRASTEYVGGGQPHNNMPPYLAVYAWRRVE